MGPLPSRWEGLWQELLRFDSPWLHPALVLIAGLSGLALGLAMRRRRAAPPRRDKLSSLAPAFPAEPEEPSVNWEAEAEALATVARQRQAEIESLQGRLVSLNQQAQEKQGRFDDLARSLRIAMEGRGAPATVAIVRARWMRFAERLRIERQHVGSEAAGLQRLEQQMTRESELLQEFLQSTTALRATHRRHQDPDEEEPLALRTLAAAEDQARTLHQHLSGALESAARVRERLKEQQIHLRDFGTAATEIDEAFDSLDKEQSHDPVAVDNALARLGTQVAGMREILPRLEADLDAETRRVLDRIDWVVNDCSAILLKALAQLKQQPVQDLGLALGLTKCLRPTATLTGMIQGTQATLKGLAPSVLPQGRGTEELSEAAAKVADCLEDARAELVRQEQEDEHTRHQVQEQEAQWAGKLAALQSALVTAQATAESQEGERNRAERELCQLAALVQEREAGAQRLQAALEEAEARLSHQSETAAAESREIERLRAELAGATAATESLRAERDAMLEKLASQPGPEDLEQLRAELERQRQRNSFFEEELLSARGRSLSVIAVPNQPGILSRRLLGLNPLMPQRQAVGPAVEPSFSDAQIALRRLSEIPAAASNGTGGEAESAPAPKAQGPDDSPLSVSSETLSLSGICAGDVVQPGQPETVLFRGRDPRHWNTAHDDGRERALPLELAPRQVAYLRLRRLDTGESVVAPCDLAGLTGHESAEGEWGWTGGSELYAGARHLGLYSASVPREAETRFGFGGWGFGHAAAQEGEQAFAWAGEAITPVDFEISVGTQPLPLKSDAAPAAASPSTPSSATGEAPASQGRQWLLFRGNDPTLWNRSVYRAAKARALALSDLPSDAAPRWLRLSRLDTGEAVVLRLAGDPLSADGTGRSRGFNGSREVFYGASHLGIFDELVPQEVETRFAFGGWGFGHRQGVEERQASGWAGREIPGDTVFEISAHEDEPELGPRDVLLRAE